MGSNWSKIKKAVEKGDQSKVLEIYNKNPEIRKKLNANAVINDYTLDTYMHCCAKHGMVEFLKLLLYENHGNPNKTNKYKQSVLHKVCEGSKDNVSYECMQLLLQWHSNSASTAQLENKKTIEMEKSSSSLSKPQAMVEIDVNAKDEVDISFI